MTADRPAVQQGSIPRLTRLYEAMSLIRSTEERIGALFAENQIPGFIHLSIGQEAVAVGVAEALRPGDTFATTHRGHGHAIAGGVDVSKFILEILGRAGGLCKGLGGSMHVADFSVGMLGANGIVGGGIATAVGSALAHARRNPGAVAVAFFGDGAIAEGILSESLNLARLWRLPILFVCENNGWSEFSSTSGQVCVEFLRLATAYEIPATRVNGDDVLAVADAAHDQVNALRSGQGPAALECITHRVRGHYEGDPQRYRTAAEMAALQASDPLQLAAKALLAGGVPDSRLEAIRIRSRDSVDRAVASALAAPLPQYEEALSCVYAEADHG